MVLFYGGIMETENKMVAKESKAANKGDGFKLRLIYAIGLLVMGVVFTCVGIVTRISSYHGNSYLEWLKNYGTPGLFGGGHYSGNGDGSFDVRLDDGRSAKFYLQDREEPYLAVNPGNAGAEEEIYVFLSENMNEETFTFARDDGEKITVSFENTYKFDQFTEYGGWDGLGLSTVMTVFLSIGLAIIALGGLQMMAAFLGKKVLWVNYLSVVLGVLFVYAYGLGVIGILGGLRGAKPLREIKKAKKEAEERRRKEEAIANKESTFTGGAFMNAVIEWVSAFVTFITLGICYPFMACWKLKWKASHTFIDGRQQVFDGNGLQFMGRYMLLLFLSAITFGIYYVLCAKVAIEKWCTLHTHFADEIADASEQTGNEQTESTSTQKKEKNSEFDGRWYQLLGANWLCNFVTIITLSFGLCWAHCYKERWFCKHRIIDGERLSFDGKAMQYFGKRLLWSFLTIVTLGIFVFWLKIKTLKWTVSHMHIVEKEQAA